MARDGLIGFIALDYAAAPPGEGSAMDFRPGRASEGVCAWNHGGVTHQAKIKSPRSKVKDARYLRRAVVARGVPFVGQSPARSEIVTGRR